jgi:FkbM family methyltransferase
MPAHGWVIDLGANRGLLSVWAAVTGAQVVAVDAQQGFAELIRALAAHNGVTGQVRVEIAMASGVSRSGATVGVAADDLRWATASHGGPARPADVTMPQLLSRYQIDRVGLLKVDIEGGEFALLAADEDLCWLAQVAQLALEVHPEHGDPASMIERLRCNGFTVDLRDNHGHHVTASSGHLAYAYCQR